LIALILANIKSSVSPLMHRVPVKLTALLLILPILYTLWRGIPELCGFEYSPKEIYSIFRLILALLIITKIILILSAAALLLRRHYVGYFITYLILLTVSLTWLGNTYSTDPRYYFSGFTGIVAGITKMNITQNEILPFIHDLSYVSYAILTLLLIVNTREDKKKTGE
jgi:hypothetical protein